MYLFYNMLSRLSGEGNGTPLRYSCLENPMDGGAWWAAVHGVAEGQTRLSDFTFTLGEQCELDILVAMSVWVCCQFIYLKILLM